MVDTARASAGPAPCTTGQVTLRPGQGVCRPAAGQHPRRLRGEHRDHRGPLGPLGPVHGQRPAVPQVAEEPVRHAHGRGGEGHLQPPLGAAHHGADLAIAESRVGVVGHRDHPVTGVEAAVRAGPGIEPLLEGPVQLDGPGGPLVHRGDHLDVGRRDAQRPRDGVGDELHHPVRGVAAGPGGQHDHLAVRRVHRGQRAAAHRRGQPGDDAAVALAVEPGQLGDRHGAGVDDVPEHPARPDRGQLRGVTHQQQPGPVRARLDQC